MQRQIRPCPFIRSLICIICCVIIAASTARTWAKESPPDFSLSSVGLSEQQFEDGVKEYLGTPYRRGGTTKKGMDCSGFARAVYDQFLGIELPHSSVDQFRSSDLQRIDARDLQAGDLVFFGNQGKQGKKKKHKQKRINHVGVYLSDGQFIHASSSGGIIVSSLDETYWKKRFIGSKRHMALTSTWDSNDFRFESYQDMLIRENGILSLYSRNEFHANSPSQNTADSVIYDPLENKVADSDSQSFHEISYSQPLFEGVAIGCSTFTEKFDVNTAWPGIELGLKEHDGSEIHNTSVRQGFTVAGDYRPTNWLSFTPSVTYFDHSGDTQNLTVVPKRTLGLNTQLSPLHNQWSLSMHIQYTDGEYINNTTTDLSNKINSFDLALKLGITLSENMQFSIMSKHDKRTSDFRATEDSLFDQPVSSDVALVFDVTY